MPKAAAIYARISSDPEGDMLGVTRQLQDCRALASRRGWPVVAEYVDDDVSAYRAKPRPAYRQMLAAIQDGSIDAVIVWHLDRLHRHPKELEEFFEVCERVRVTDLASVTGDVDLSTHDGQFLARILGAVAKKESDDKSRRVRRKHLEMALAGRGIFGGTRPFGYQADFRTPDPVEAPAVREAAARILAGDSLRALAGSWNERGMRTVGGNEWSASVLRNMLLSARLSGQRSYHGEIVAKGDWDPILTPTETARLRALLTDPARLTRRTVRRYLLAGGLLVCGVCAAVLRSRPRVDGTRRYICPKGPGLPGCGGVAILAEPLEALITEAVLYRLDSPQLAAFMDGSAPTGDDPERATLAEDQAQLEELATAYGERQITLKEYLAARKPIEARIERARRAIATDTGTAALVGFVGHADRLRDAWQDMPLSRQRAVVAAVLDRAVIGRAVRGRNFFDPARVDPVWRV